MKRCPYCAEEIQDAAIKCKHCGEFLDGSGGRKAAESALPWYCRSSIIVIGLLCVGPLALPLLWLRPKTSLGWKAGVSVAVLVLSGLLALATMKSLETLGQYYELLQ